MKLNKLKTKKAESFEIGKFYVVCTQLILHHPQLHLCVSKNKNTCNLYGIFDNFIFSEYLEYVKHYHLVIE